MLWQSYCISLQVFPVSKQPKRPAETVRVSTSNSAYRTFQVGQFRLRTAGDSALCTSLYLTWKRRCSHLKQAAKTFNPVGCSLPFLLSTECAYKQALHRKMTEVCQFGKLIKLHRRISAMNMQQGKPLEISCCITHVFQIFEQTSVCLQSGQT